MEVQMLIYDIPDTAGFPNPSSRLRPIAIRVNLSCWIVPTHLIPWGLLHRMERAGCKWRTVKFDREEGDKLVGMAVDSIKGELNAAIARARKSARYAEMKYRRSKKAPEIAQGEYIKARNLIQKRIRKLVKELRQVTTNFGIRETLPFASTLDAVNAIHAEMAARARTYVEATSRIRYALGQNDPVALAAARDAIPAEIMADYLADHNLNDDDLRTAFNPEPSEKKAKFVMNPTRKLFS